MLTVEGAIFVDVEVPGPTPIKARAPQQFYVVSNVQQSFLSKHLLVDLGIISEDFPKAGEAWERNGDCWELSRGSM